MRYRGSAVSTDPIVCLPILPPLRTPHGHEGRRRDYTGGRRLDDADRRGVH
jgi:hypothetical protein